MKYNKAYDRDPRYIRITVLNKDPNFSLDINMRFPPISYMWEIEDTEMTEIAQSLQSKIYDLFANEIERRKIK